MDETLYEICDGISRCVSWTATTRNGSQLLGDYATPLDEPMSWKVFFCIVGVVIVIVLAMISAVHRCPKCNRSHAVEKKGVKADGREEWNCRYCGYRLVYGNTCPKCNRRQAMKQTEAKVDVNDRQEWCCKYCGYQERRDQEPSVDFSVGG